jgi:hypothetical protein
MPKTRGTHSKTDCRCSEFGTARHYRSSVEAAIPSLVDYADIDGLWHYIARCTICEQLWEMRTDTGHAMMERAETITLAEATKLIERERAYQREMESQRPLAKADPEQATSSLFETKDTKSKAFRDRMAQVLVLGFMGAGCALVLFMIMTQQETPELILWAGGLMLAGIAVAAINALIEWKS